MKELVSTVFKNAFMHVSMVTNKTFSEGSNFITFGRNKTKHGAIIIPVDSTGKVTLIKEYRIGADVSVVGVPKGAADTESESAESIASRELSEELGMTFSGLKSTGLKVYPLPAFADFWGEVVVATGVEVVKNPELEDGECIQEFGKFSQDELKDLLKQGVINDAESVAAIQHYLLFEQ
ncbi:NUDIX hydrolase [Vibrio crassostreae]|uniref:NUDIX hydrolase n=1 Tax=Vibrio crassostreae TaxID=246167 RepID=UPI001B30C463|nr:NUDIX hydrolase [Vibrio crassostreae]